MQIRINGKPRPHWGEDQVTQFERHMTPLEIDEAWGPLRGPVVLRLRFVFENLDPRGHLPVVEAPLPALVRGVLDYLCGRCWANEKQLVAVHAAKEYGNTSATIIKFDS